MREGYGAIHSPQVLQRSARSDQGIVRSVGWSKKAEAKGFSAFRTVVVRLCLHASGALSRLPRGRQARPDLIEIKSGKSVAQRFKVVPVPVPTAIESP